MFVKCDTNTMPQKKIQSERKFYFCYMQSTSNKLDKLRDYARLLPNRPGVYRFYDHRERIIYVGKAKNLRKRVLSYFSKSPTGKHALLMKNLARIDHIITTNETEAFLLENIQIKQHKPKYNILLKDDKTYPWIVIRKEAFPRVELTRRPEKNKGEYFGPYPSVRTARVLLELIHDSYPLRTCSYDLSPEKIAKKRYQVCLEYHLGRCKAPCTGNQSPQEYEAYIKEVRQILQGNFRPALQRIESEMLRAAEKLEFEKAQSFKEKLDALRNYQARSTVVNPALGNVAVFGMVEDAEVAYVNFMEVANGAIIRARNLEIRKRMNEPSDQLLAWAIGEVFAQIDVHARELILPMATEIPLNLKQTIPRRGDKRKLLEMSEQNARYFRMEKHKQLQITDPQAHTRRMLAQMQDELNLKQPPRHIECFDISHTQGMEKTASCVVFRNLKPAKKDYRHYTLRTVEGIDDYASMREVVYRRYKRLLDEGQALPQLVVIDGGKGQLNAAMDSLRELGLHEQLNIIGIAKRLEEIYRPGDPIPLYLDKRSETLKIIQQIRNEAHRFGLRLHRKRRHKTSLHSSLTDIPGIGEKTAIKLLKHFKSLKRIQEATLDELERVAGKKTARKIHIHFKRSL